MDVKLKKRKVEYNVSALTNQDDLSYYLLGAFISDGNVEKTLNKASISSKDIDWLESIKNLIAPTAKLNKIKKSNNRVLKLYNKTIAGWLIKNQCVPNKSLIAKMPEIPTQYLRDFVRGIFDGDGSLAVKFKSKTESKFWITRKDIKEKRVEYISCYICSSSLHLIQSLSERLLTMGFNHQLYPQKLRSAQTKDGRIIKSQSPNYRMQFSTKDCGKFLQWIYYPKHKVSLKRKLIKAQEIIYHYFQDEVMGKESRL